MIWLLVYQESNFLPCFSTVVLKKLLKSVKNLENLNRSYNSLQILNNNNKFLPKINISVFSLKNNSNLCFNFKIIFSLFVIVID